MTEDLLQQVKDFIEMEQRSGSMHAFSPEYVARNMQISKEDATEALKQLESTI